MATLTTAAAVATTAKAIRATVTLLSPPLKFTNFHSKFTIKTTTFLPFRITHKTFTSFCTNVNTNINTENPQIVSSSSLELSNSKNEEKKIGEEKNEDKKESSIASIREMANLLDIRVGKIIKAWRHQEADSLYVEEIDVGETVPRIICSGLVKYIPIENLQGRKVIVLANLKPRNMRGVKSNGMLMAASDAPHENVELLEPPEDAVPGERIWFGSEEDKENQPDPASPNQIQKKKIWEQVQPHLKTDDSCTAMLGGEHLMRTSAGVVASKSLRNANIS